MQIRCIVNKVNKNETAVVWRHHQATGSEAEDASSCRESSRQSSRYEMWPVWSCLSLLSSCFLLSSTVCVSSCHSGLKSCFSNLFVTSKLIAARLVSHTKLASRCVVRQQHLYRLDLKTPPWSKGPKLHRKMEIWIWTFFYDKMGRLIYLWGDEQLHKLCISSLCVALTCFWFFQV